MEKPNHSRQIYKAVVEWYGNGLPELDNKPRNGLVMLFLACQRIPDSNSLVVQIHHWLDTTSQNSKCLLAFNYNSASASAHRIVCVALLMISLSLDFRFLVQSVRFHTILR